MNWDMMYMELNGLYMLHWMFLGVNNDRYMLSILSCVLSYWTSVILPNSFLSTFIFRRLLGLSCTHQTRITFTCYLWMLFMFFVKLSCIIYFDNYIGVHIFYVLFLPNWKTNDIFYHVAEVWSLKLNLVDLIIGASNSSADPEYHQSMFSSPWQAGCFPTRSLEDRRCPIM